MCRLIVFCSQASSYLTCICMLNNQARRSNFSHYLKCKQLPICYVAFVVSLHVE
jgi:hypothetical protein